MMEDYGTSTNQNITTKKCATLDKQHIGYWEWQDHLA